MNSYDLGCGPGGGDSALQTFEAAGLAFSDGDQLTPVRKSENRGGRGAGGGKMKKKEGPEGVRQEEEGWEGLGRERVARRGGGRPCTPQLAAVLLSTRSKMSQGDKGPEKEKRELPKGDS